MNNPLLYIAFLSCAISARGAISAINNLAAGTQGFAAGLSGPLAEIFFSPYEDRAMAFSFTTGTAPATVTNLRFLASMGGEGGLHPIHVGLSTGSPVAGPVSSVSMGTVTPASFTPVTQTLEVSPPLTITLTPSTTYWVHFTVPAGDAVYTVHNSNAPILEPGWALGNSFYFDPLGGWSEITSGVQARVQLNVEIIPVPEPSSVLLLPAALMLVARRRRR